VQNESGKVDTGNNFFRGGAAGFPSPAQEAQPQAARPIRVKALEKSGAVGETN
jgi:hypothetical protein